jgi:phenylalanyl-tRNA synthetase beta chain
MKVPLSWLREFVAIDADLDELCRRLTAAGVEVEDFERLTPAFSGVVVARVLKVERHPNADRLSLCEVDAGAAGRFNVVCGAPNVKRGMKAALAKVGARLSAGGKSAEAPPPLQAAEIRGVRSEGMLCSERELGLSDAHGGILALDGAAPVGADLAVYLDLEDTVLDIAITANRGDCLSVLGLAREIGALFDARLKAPKLAPLGEAVRAGAPGAERAPMAIEILAPDLCPRYAALAMEGITIGPSPIWLQRRLELCGMRPLNNVVDVTNYVMLERGKPLHAFDRAQIEEDRIVVRRADTVTDVFVTLDGAKRELTPSDLMIADGRRMLAIAGVMGGLNSEVSDSTTAIVLESAYFEPMAVARTSRRLGLRSEASYRFERGIDRQGQVAALIRAASLIGSIAGGQSVGSIVDIEPQPAPAREIDLDLNAMAALLGVKIPAAEVARRLRALGARVTPNSAARSARLTVSPPSFRPDLNEPADLAEEVARLKGMEEIPAVLPMRVASPSTENPQRRFARQTREVMVGCGLTEVKTIAFIAPADNERFPGLDGAAPIKVVNPLSAELSELRLSIIPGLLAALRFNLNRQSGAFHGFEIAKVFGRGSQLPAEAHRLAAISYGEFGLGTVGTPSVMADFFSLKGIVETWMRTMDLQRRIEFERAGAPFTTFLHPGRAARIKLDGKMLGCVGELHPREAMRLELTEPCALCELDIGTLIAYGSRRKSIEPPPRYPAIRRDLALVLDRDFPAESVVRTVAQIESPWLEGAELFDVYEGESVGAGKKSVAFALSYRAKDRTLTDEEVNRAHAALVTQALSRLGAELRH